MKTIASIIAPLALASVAVAGDYPLSLSSNMSYSLTTGTGGSVVQTGSWDPMDPYVFQYATADDGFGNQAYQYAIFAHGCSAYDVASNQTLLGDAYDVTSISGSYAGIATYTFTLAQAARFESFNMDAGISATLNGSAITTSTFTQGDTIAAGTYTLSYSFGAGSSYEYASFRFTEFPVGVPAPGALALLGVAGLARGRRRG